jgi:hypothetical protein
MHKDLGPLLKNLPPATARALEQAINRCGGQLGIGPDWVRRWIAFTVTADALASYRGNDGPLFELKGGAAIEMRLRKLDAEAETTAPPPATGSRAESPTIRPRATKDLDATYRGAMGDLEEAVRAALAAPRHRFAFRVELETPVAPVMRRFRIRVSYQEERFNRTVLTSFSNVQLEVSTYEGTHRTPDMVPAYSLTPFGFEGPDTLPCIPLAKQIAQKLHAVTEPPAPGRTNDRFRDLLDIVMLSALVAPSPDLREVCEETFAIRDKQGWPPEIVTYPHWVEPMERRAEEIGLDQKSAAVSAQHVADYVRAIAQAVL